MLSQIPQLAVVAALALYTVTEAKRPHPRSHLDLNKPTPVLQRNQGNFTLSRMARSREPKQLTRDGLMHQKRRREARRLRGDLRPRASPVPHSYDTCPQMFDLQVSGLAYYPAWNYASASAGPSITVNNLNDCLQYCLGIADNACKSFLWVGDLDNGDYGCYPKTSGLTLSNGPSWEDTGAYTAAAYSGMYILDQSCAQMLDVVPTAVDAVCCSTDAFIPESTTCPALYNLDVSPGLAYFTNWDYNAGSFAITTTNTLKDCYNYCSVTHSADCVAFNWDPNTLECAAKDDTSNPFAWSYMDASSQGTGGGTYFLGLACAEADVPAQVYSQCCQTQVYTTRSYPTCPSDQTTLSTPESAFYYTWNYRAHDQSYATSVTTVDQCRQQCEDQTVGTCSSFLYDADGQRCWTKGLDSSLTDGIAWEDATYTGLGPGMYAYDSCEVMDAMGIVPPYAQADCCNTAGSPP